MGDSDKEQPSKMKQSLTKSIKDEVYKIQLKVDVRKFAVPDTKSKKKGDTITILNPMSATFQPGTMTAIMGSSGAGKTTFLNVLSGRSDGILDGQVLLNGNKLEDSAAISKYQAYVMQDDIFLKTQTPEEILGFSANLRMPRECTEEQKDSRVTEIIEMFNISNSKDTRVGAAGVQRGISGGERKRLSIGMELITNPTLLFLDEPTSGLDSFTSEQVMYNLKDLAASGRTVVATIHQPNSYIYHLFDNLILLSKGRMIYNGPAKEAVDHFASIGYEVPENTNPADYFMEIMSVDGNDAEGLEKIKEMETKYLESTHAVNQAEVKTKKREIVADEHDNGYPQSFGTQFSELMKRNISHLKREPLKARATIGQSIFISIFMGLIYLFMDDDQEAIQDRQGFLFFVSINLAFTSMSGVVNTFPEEKVVYFREHGNTMYSPTAYFFARVVSDFPLQIIAPALFSCIVYFLVGLQADFGKFIMFLLFVVLVNNVGGQMGLSLGVVAPNAQVATAILPLVVIPFMMFSGYLVNSDNVPAYFSWIPYISFVKYTNEGLIVNEFKGLKLECTEEQKIFVNGTEGGIRRCPFENGEEVIDSLGYDGSVPVNLMILAIMYGVFVLISYGFLRFVSGRHKAAA